jgi:hypothetical protein
LTDGRRAIRAIEFKPISELHTKMTPGSKIQLSGSMLVQNGSLYIKPKNFKYLGKVGRKWENLMGLHFPES